MTLYLVSSPIGNLGDITIRALATLKECDYLLCEDTRHSGILLKHYEIQKPLKSYHLFNEERKKGEIIADLKLGKTIGLLSDAGTPLIADPGFRLVSACYAEGIPVFSLPGPCAALTALVSSGLPADRFQFLGFFPKKKSELKKLLQETLIYPGTSIGYESPYRLKVTLSVLGGIDPQREVVVARELTKKFEEVVSGTPETLKEKWKDRPPKGEIVLLIRGETV